MCFFSANESLRARKPESEPMSDLNLKIASAGTVEDLLSIAERDSGTYKREHYVFWVKNLSKMLNKNFSAKEYGVLVGSETYSKIAQNIVSDIQNLSPTGNLKSKS